LSRDGCVGGYRIEREVYESYTKMIMDEPKTAIPQELITEFLSRYYDHSIQRLSPLKRGHHSQVYAFYVDNVEYVIRAVTSTKATSFTKEQFIFEHLLSEQIPIARNLHIGQTDEFYFAIAYRFPGITVDTLLQSDHDEVVPQLIMLLDAIHQTDITQYHGNGYFDERGIGCSESWSTFLTSVREEEPEDSFHGRWHKLFDETFLERDTFFRIYEQMIECLAFCPEERHLLHGDYGNDNVLVEKGKVTAILDWSQAQFGDFLYEVAHLDFWSPRIAYLARFQAYYQKQNRSLPAYEHRLRCYQCHTTLGAMRFFSKVGNQDAYGWVLQRAQELGIVKVS